MLTSFLPHKRAATKKTRFEIFAKQILAQRWCAIRQVSFSPGIQQISGPFFAHAERAGAEREQKRKLRSCVESQGPSSLHQSKHHHPHIRFFLFLLPPRPICETCCTHSGALSSSARDKSIFVGDGQQCWRDDRWLLIMHLDFAERRDVRT